MLDSIANGAPRYDRVRLVMGDSDLASVAGIEGGFHQRGLRRTWQCSSLDHLYDTLDAEIVDVLMYDYDLLGDEYVDAMQRIRRSVRGRNPFLIIVATVRDSAFETVKRLMRAGVDDLIRKPISMDRVFGSLEGLAAKRKPFRVSYNYVGPTHRMRDRPAGLTPDVIRVPNTLRSRAIEGVSDEEIERTVATAVARLDEKRYEAYGSEISDLTARIAELHGATVKESTREGEQELKSTLRQLESVADDLRERCRNSEFARVGDLATMLIAIAQRMVRKSATQAAVEVQLLEKLAQAIHRALSVERHSVNVMQEIASTVARFTRLN